MPTMLGAQNMHTGQLRRSASAAAWCLRLPPLRLLRHGDCGGCHHRALAARQLPLLHFALTVLPRPWPLRQTGCSAAATAGYECRFRVCIRRATSNLFCSEDPVPECAVGTADRQGRAGRCSSAVAAARMNQPAPVATHGHAVLCKELMLPYSMAKVGFCVAAAALAAATTIESLALACSLLLAGCCAAASYTRCINSCSRCLHHPSRIIALLVPAFSTFFPSSVAPAGKAWCTR